MADGGQPSHEQGGDLFKNFSMAPPRSQGPFRAFTRRSRYKYMGSSSSSREKLMRAGSNTSIASISGSTHNLLDPAKIMSMQEDARHRKITSEVMKSRLYESVITSPRKRRFSMRMDYSSACMTPSSETFDPQAYARMVQSLPVTPAHSQNVSPEHSPTTNRRFLFGFFSRGATPHCLTPEEVEEDDAMECEEANSKGLASLFKAPYLPRLRSSRNRLDVDEDEDVSMEEGIMHRGGGLLGPPEPPGILLRSVPRLRKRAKSPNEAS